MTSTDTPKSISSTESLDGHTPSSSLDGLQIDLFGQPVVPAPPSPSQASRRNALLAKAETLCGTLDRLASRYVLIASTHGLPMNGTFGRKCGGSQPSAALDASLVNKLRARPDWTGSLEFEVHWKSSITVLGLPVCLLQVSGHRTFDDVFGGWPTPTKANAEGSQSAKEASSTGRRPDGSKATVALPAVARLANWATPTARDFKDTAGMALESKNPDGSVRKRTDLLGRQAILCLGSWATPRASDGEKNIRTTDGAMKEADRKSPANDLGTTSALSRASTEKTRRTEPGTFPLATGVPARVGRISAYGNAIAAPLAAIYIEVFRDLIDDA